MILILDFGSQYTQLIARRVRELGVYCEALPPARAAEKIAAAVPGGIILSGGPDSVAAADAPLVPDAVFSWRRAGVGDLLRHASDGGALRRRCAPFLAALLRARRNPSRN